MSLTDDLPVRYFTVSLIVLSALVVYITRQNLNLAMVSMTENDKTNQNHVSGEVEICPKKYTENINTTLPDTDKESLDVHHELRLRDKKYYWSQSTQGYIFGGFFWSYIVLQMFTGVLAQKYGGYPIIVVCLLVSAVISGATPFVTDYVWLLILLRVLLGCFQSGFFPAAFGLICRWIPTNARSVCFALLDMGSVLGSIATFYTTGYIDKTYGWPSLFFIPGILTAAVFILVAFTLRSDPNECSFISLRELRFINEDVKKGKLEDKKSHKTPFLKIIRNVPVLTAAFFKFSHTFVGMMIGSKLPVYLDKVMNEDLEDNGHVNAYINLIIGASILMNGFLSDLIINRGYLSRTRTRKSFSIVSGFISATCIMCIPSAGCDTKKLHTILYFWSLAHGFVAGSDAPLPSDMTKNFPAVMYALLNMVSMSCGFFAPAFAGLLLDNMKNQWMAWSIIFYFSSGLLILSTIVFLVFASAERQPFDFIDDPLDEYKLIEKGVISPPDLNTIWTVEVGERHRC